MPDLTADSIRALRHALGMTQQAFANHMGVSITSVRDWEQKRRKPRGLYARALEQQIAAHQGTEAGKVAA